MILLFLIFSILPSNTDFPRLLNGNMLLLVNVLKDISMLNGGINLLLIPLK
jgi:hypothetical protein